MKRKYNEILEKPKIYQFWNTKFVFWLIAMKYEKISKIFNMEETLTFHYLLE